MKTKPALFLSIMTSFVLSCSKQAETTLRGPQIDPLISIVSIPMISGGVSHTCTFRAQVIATDKKFEIVSNLDTVFSCQIFAIPYESSWREVIKIHVFSFTSCDLPNGQVVDVRGISLDSLRTWAYVIY